jgi:hypothetical protein
MTIQLLPHLTGEQEMFDHVCAHLGRQKKRAIKNSNFARCAYYNEDDGNRCAIGACVSEDDARTLEAEHDARTLEAEHANQSIDMVDDFDPGSFDINFLLDLQMVHDDAFNLATLREGLLQMADNWALKADAAYLITEWARL